MIYGSPCCYTNVENLKVLEKVQKKCVEWISNSYYVNESYKNLLLATDILTIFIYLQLPHLLERERGDTLLFQYTYAVAELIV